MLTSPDAARVVGAEGAELWPVEAAVVGADLGDLFLVALDAPVGPDVVSVDEALLLLLGLRVGQPGSERPQYDLPCEVHVVVINNIEIKHRPQQAIFA